MRESVLFDSDSGVNLPANRRSVGYLLQTLALFPHMTVLQNVEYGLAALEASEREARCREILESFRISALARAASAAKFPAASVSGWRWRGRW